MMQELDFCSNSGQVQYLNEELGRQQDRVFFNDIFVVLSVRVRSMCCGNVLLTKIVGW